MNSQGHVADLKKTWLSLRILRVRLTLRILKVMLTSRILKGRLTLRPCDKSLLFWVLFLRISDLEKHVLTLRKLRKFRNFCKFRKHSSGGCSQRVLKHAGEGGENSSPF